MASSSAQNPRDGLIDFSKYSTDQLVDLQFSIDRISAPLNYRNLLAELESRHTPDEDHLVVANRWPIRLTRHTGILGWLEAVGRWQQIYGEGWIEIGSDDVVLHGWRRTWLGVGQQTTIEIPSHRVRNVGWDDAFVRLEHGHRRTAFRARSTEEARQIVGRLPSAQTAGFEQKWSQLRRFQRAVDAGGTGVWVTGAIVLANVLTFIALTIRGKRAGNFDLPQLLDWGANYGPLTVHGQWWRLISATFLHLDPVHLIVNMWALWNVGRLSERLYGRWTFLGLYFSTALLASLTSVLWDPTRVSAGASGAIFGIFGAFLAYLARQRSHVPPSIFRSHWFSTLAFVVFSLISGALQTGIDNAAHIGGLISGFAIGWIVVRPLEATGRTPLRSRQVFTATALFVALATAGAIQVRGAGSQLTDLEKYWQAHDWYVRGELENLRLWQAVAAQAGAGKISNLEIGYQFETNILPFWVTTERRLTNEDATVPAEQKRYDSMLRDYVRNRREWADAIISVNKDRDGKTIADVQDLAKKSDRITARMERIKLRDGMTHRPRALSNNTLMTFVHSRLFGGDVACIRAPVSYHWRRVADTDLKSDGPAMSEASGCKAQRAFNEDDFSALEAMFDFHGKALNDLPDGNSSLNAIAGGLSDLFEFGQRNLLEDLGRTADWRRSYPNSPIPDLIDAMIFHNAAWVARGSGTGDTISPQMNALYNYRTEMAAAALEEIKPHSDDNPLWYHLAIDVGLDQSLELKKLRAIFDEGIAKFPEDIALYRRMIRVLLPRWSGSHQQEVQFISDMDAKADGRSKKQLYARLVWIYSDWEEDRENIFDPAGIDWPMVRDGFRDLMTRYSKSDVVANGFAKMACQADAAKEYVELRPLLKTRLSAIAWSDGVSLAKCDDKFKEALQSAHVGL